MQHEVTDIKKLVLTLLITIIAMLCCGCRKLSDEADMSQDYCRKIILALDEQNPEALKNLLSDKKRSKDNIDEEIAAVLNAYEGQSTSYTPSSLSTSGGGYYHGVEDDNHFSPIIKDIVTDSGKTYNIRFFYYSVYHDRDNNVSINYLYLYDENDKELACISYDE